MPWRCVGLTGLRVSPGRQYTANASTCEPPDAVTPAFVFRPESRDWIRRLTIRSRRGEFGLGGLPSFWPLPPCQPSEWLSVAPVWSTRVTPVEHGVWQGEGGAGASEPTVPKRAPAPRTSRAAPALHGGVSTPQRPEPRLPVLSYDCSAITPTSTRRTQIAQSHGFDDASVVNQISQSTLCEQGVVDSNSICSTTQKPQGMLTLNQSLPP